MAYIKISNEVIKSNPTDIMKILDEYFDSMIISDEMPWINTTIYEVQKEGLPKGFKEVVVTLQRDGDKVKVVECKPWEG